MVNDHAACCRECRTGTKANCAHQMMCRCHGGTMSAGDLMARARAARPTPRDKFQAFPDADPADVWVHHSKSYLAHLIVNVWGERLKDWHIVEVPDA